MAVREQKQHRSNFSILFRIYLLNYVFILPVLQMTSSLLTGRLTKEENLSDQLMYIVVRTKIFFGYIVHFS